MEAMYHIIEFQMRGRQSEAFKYYAKTSVLSLQFAVQILFLCGCIQQQRDLFLWRDVRSNYGGDLRTDESRP